MPGFLDHVGEDRLFRWGGDVAGGAPRFPASGAAASAGASVLTLARRRTNAPSGSATLGPSADVGPDAKPRRGASMRALNF